MKLFPPPRRTPVRRVAPRVGAWIETMLKANVLRYCGSHPVWVRGLKLSFRTGDAFRLGVAPRVGAWIETRWFLSTSPGVKSHPVWVRGLKPAGWRTYRSYRRSHPVWVRGLKQSFMWISLTRIVSHPVWVRGLKQERRIKNREAVDGRTPCGCVD